MDTALSPLRQIGIRILNYLDDWLVRTQSNVELLSHRTLILRVNFTKSTLSPSQRILFLGTDHALAMQKLKASFKSGTSRPIKAFQMMLGLMATALPVLQLGLLRMQPLQCWLKPRVPPHTWCHRRLQITVSHACVTALVPWKNPHWMEKGVAMGMVCSMKVVTTDAFNTGWGAL